MKKLIMLPCIIMSAVFLSCSSNDDKSLSNEAENVMTEKESVNSANFTISDSSMTRGIEFCIFGTFCDENGRQAEAIQYEVSAWTFSGDTEDPRGDLLYERQLNPMIVTDNEDGTSEESAEPLCLNLPDTEEEDQYYLEIYYGGLIRSGIISDTQVKDLFAGEGRVDYFHFREGNCNLSDSPDLF